MKRRRWLFGPVAVAGVLALVAPAVSQGKAESGSLRWSLFGGGSTITTYVFRAQGSGSPVSRSFRLRNSGVTGSGKLAIKLSGSSVFSIGSDRCSGKHLNVGHSCVVSVVYAQSQAGVNDNAALTASPGSGTAAPLALGNAGHVYWVDYYGTVHKVALAGGKVTMLAHGARIGDIHNAVAVGKTRVYWVEDGPNATVNAVPLGGGTVTTLATGQSFPHSVAVDATHVYWATGDGNVNEVPLGGGSVTTLATGQSPTSVAVNGGYVYWGNRGDGTVNEVPVGGGTVTTLASGQTSPSSLVVYGTHLYWLGSGNPDVAPGTVNEVPLGGGSVTTLAGGINFTFSLAVEGTHVYWTDGGDGHAVFGTLNETPIGGGAASGLADAPNAVSLAANGAHVYWATWGGGVNTVAVASGKVTNIAGGSGYPAAVALGP